MAVPQPIKLVPANGIHAALQNAGIKGYTTKTVAEMLGVSAMTISRWRKAGLVKPQAFHHGKLTVYVFSDKDVQICRDIQQRLRPGRRAAGDDSVRITKPPRPPTISPQTRQRHARLKQLRKERASASTVPPGHVHAASKKGD